MFIAMLVFALFQAPATPAEVIVVNLPAKGSTSVPLAPAGKMDFQRAATVSLIHVEVGSLQPVQSLSPAMNSYVVWAVSPEGSIENVGELSVNGAKGSLDSVTQFDQFGILITAEPYFLVDRPSSVVAYRTQVPKSESVRRTTVSVEVGHYDYSKLQPVAASSSSLVAQARSALQVAAGVQADRLAESEYRLARIALGTVEEMLLRAAPMEIVQPVAYESIRRSQRAFIAARDKSR